MEPRLSTKIGAPANAQTGCLARTAPVEVFSGNDVHSVSNIDGAFQTKEIRMNSTQRVVENHIQRFREGDLDGVLEDFSPDAVVFTPSGTLKGKSEIKTLFQNMLQEFGKAGASETVRTAIFEGDYAYLIWSGETVDNNYEFATDTFVLRNGKIVMQSFAAKVTPKR
jgi:ketosteroid isomerase-like protein